MIVWLTERGIVPDESLSKPEIYQIVKENKSSAKKYELDTIMSKFGHNVLRLPPLPSRAQSY